MAVELPHFQYDTPTVTVDDLVLDAAALNAYIRRAESAYNKGNIQYCIGKDCPQMGKGMPDIEAASGKELFLDCSGFAWWVTYRRGIQAHTAGESWVQVSQPIPGATTRYDPKPGRNYGHSGVIIAPGKTPGNFQTLDSTDAKSPPRTGSILYAPDGRTRWITNGGPNSRFLVSSEAVISKGGVPVKRKLNVLLAAAKHPIATGLGLIAVVLGLAGFFVYRKRFAGAESTPAA